MSTELLTNDTVPDWVTAEMPPGYQNRLAEIARLSAELRDLDRFGRLLWCVGDDLADAVRDVFAGLGFDTQTIPGAGAPSLTVRLDGGRRLLLRSSSTAGTIQKKSPDIASVFQLVHELAEDADRVVLVTNSEPRTRPASRPEAATADALNLFRRLGANVMDGSTVFALWTLSLQDRERARSYVTRLHEQDGGMFALSAAATR